MVVIFDIRDLLSGLRREYVGLICTVNKHMRYDEQDFREFALWLVQKYFYEIRCHVQNFNKDHTLYKVLAGSVISEKIHGNTATLYDMVYLIMCDMKMNFISEPNYLYSLLLVQDNLVIGRTNLSYITQGPS